MYSYPYYRHQTPLADRLTGSFYKPGCASFTLTLKLLNTCTSSASDCEPHPYYNYEYLPESSSRIIYMCAFTRKKRVCVSLLDPKPNIPKSIVYKNELEKKHAASSITDHWQAVAQTIILTSYDDIDYYFELRELRTKRCMAVHYELGRNYC